MKSFAIYANCQGEGLARALLGCDYFKNEYFRIKIPPVHLIKDHEVKLVMEAIRGIDLLIFQPVKISFDRPKELNSSFILNQLKDNAIKFSFPSIYFDGYFPHLKTMDRMVSILNLVHDYFIAYSYNIGLSQKKCYELINDLNLYPEDLSRKLAEKSIQNLRNREVANNIDIPVSNFILRNFRFQKLFNQFNHPTRDIFVFLAKAIFRKLKLEKDSIEDFGISYSDEIVVPVYRSTHRNLKLKFSENFNTYQSILNKNLSQWKLIEQFYAFYKQLNQDKLKEIITQNCEFIPEIIEAKL